MRARTARVNYTPRMVGRSILANAAFTLAGQLASRLLALGFYAMLARAHGTARYGDQGLGAAIGTLLVVLVEPGLNQLMVRDGARNRAHLQEQLALGLGFKLVMLAVTWPLAALVGLLLGWRDATLWAVVWAGGTILCGALEDLAAAALTAMERLDLEAGARLLSKTLTSGLGIAAIALGASFETVLASVTLGTALAGLAGMLLVRHAGVAVRVTVSPSGTLPLLREAWPLAVHNLLWLITMRLDQVLAGAMGVPSADLGAYNGAVKLLEALVLFPVAVVSAFHAAISRSGTRGPGALSASLGDATAMMLALCVPVAVGGAVLGTPLATLVYGDAFARTGPLLGVQLAALVFVGLQSLASVGLTARGVVRVQAWTVAINLGVNVTVNVVAVPRLGIMGASMAAVAGGVAASVAYAAAMHRAGIQLGVLRGCWRPLLAAVAMAGVLGGAPLGTLPVLASVVVGGCVYTVVFVGLGGMRVLNALRVARRET